MVHASPPEVNQTVDAGIDDFLTKPPNLNDLRIRLRVAKRILGHTARIRSLEKVLTICAYTKKIKMDDGNWEALEQFMVREFGFQLSHGVEPGYYEQVILTQLDAMEMEFENQRNVHSTRLAR